MNLPNEECQPNHAARNVGGDHAAVFHALDRIMEVAADLPPGPTTDELKASMVVLKHELEALLSGRTGLRVLRLKPWNEEAFADLGYH